MLGYVVGGLAALVIGYEVWHHRTDIQTKLTGKAPTSQLPAKPTPSTPAKIPPVPGSETYRGVNIDYTTNTDGKLVVWSFVTPNGVLMTDTASTSNMAQTAAHNAIDRGLAGASSSAAGGPSVLTVPNPAPHQPADPPAMYLGPDGPIPTKAVAGADFDRVIREALAWDADPASLDRYLKVASANGWNTAANLILLKRNGLIAHPQPYPYLQTQYPNYLRVGPDGSDLPPIDNNWDMGLDTQSRGVAMFLLANELDMGNLAQAQQFYAQKGFGLAAQHFADKYNAQAAVRKDLGATLPSLTYDTASGKIMSTHLAPMPPLTSFIQKA